MVVYPSLLRRLESLAHWQLYQYALPMHNGVREGFILKTTFLDGQQGWGEIAPLPGWSKESLTEAKEQLLQLLQKEGVGNLFPSIAFGLESALIPYQATTTRFPLWALVLGSVTEMREKARRAQAEGFSALKVKVSHLTFQQAESLLAPLIGIFRLRVDVNRAWTAEHAIAFFSQFSHGDIECIEEPTYELEKLATFPLPFALDESLLELGRLDQYPNLTTLIIKPTMMGGTEVIESFKQLGKKILVTGAFESGIGTVQIARLADRLGLQDFPLGLDTYRFLKKDLLRTPLDFSQGFLQLPADIEFNDSAMIEVAHA